MNKWFVRVSNVCLSIKSKDTTYYVVSYFLVVVAVFYTTTHFSALYLLFVLITQYKYTFLESWFFSFIWYQIRLDMVKLKVGHALNNMKSMEKELIQIRCHGNGIQQHAEILSTKNIPGIIVRDPRSIYARNNQLYTSNIHSILLKKF